MSERVAYIARTDTGGLVRGVTIVGEHSTETWEADLDEAIDAGVAIDQARAAARWIAERAKAGPKIAALIVDVDGASCSWLTVPSGEAAVIAAALEQSETSPLGEHGLRPPGVSRAGSSIQALGLANGAAGTAVSLGDRRAVLCMPDAIVRVLLDELDARGAVPHAVLSMWHAIALAWDPGAASDAGATARERIVASSDQTTGIIVIDDEGQLLWSWTSAGRLLACGRLRLTMGSQRPRAGADQIARLASDWLAWSIQRAQAPTRIVCVTPQLDGEDSGLTPADIGRRLGDLWPGASVDMAVLDDPIAETLARLAPDRARESDASHAVVELTRRPGRAHRSLHRAMALVALALGVALATHAWVQRQTAAAARAEAASLKAEIHDKVGAAIPGASDIFMREQVDAEIARLTGAEPTGEMQPAMPILEELERISLSMGTIGAEWESLDMHSYPPLVSLKAYFDEGDIQGVEQLKQQLGRMPGTQLVNWRRGAGQKYRNRFRYDFEANWSDEALD